MHASQFIQLQDKIEDFLSQSYTQIEDFDKFSVFFRPLAKDERFHKYDSDSSVSIIEDPNDDECYECEEGGSLVCCDFCSKSFHQGCAGVRNLPEGKWSCKYCTKNFEKNERNT